MTQVERFNRTTALMYHQRGDTRCKRIRFATFKDVERHYNNIKPVVSKYHKKEDDIRPINRRDRKWERIEKRSDTEYVFHDYYFREELAKHTEWQKRPPIVWEAKEMPTGTRELVTVRGSTRWSFDISRHNFLRAYLPVGLFWCVNTNGTHEVLIENGISGVAATSHYMPRPKNYGLKAGPEVTDYLLQFVRVNSEDNLPMWECITPEWPKLKLRVDKNRKKQLKQHNDEFWGWMCSVGPMLDMEWSTLESLSTEIIEYMKTSGKQYGFSLNGGKIDPWKYSYGIRNQFPRELAEEIVKDYNHPLRIHLACNFLQLNDIKSIGSKEDNNTFRSAYNRWFNTTLGLVERKEI